ncbi:MAG: hypothetical protein IPJ08_14645 [Burkholderiales bacterium]|nr:hypothetical protein [Burkholderiales bacterium]
MTQLEWSAAYVRAWSELVSGDHDLHATWDDARDAYESMRHMAPTDAAQADFGRMLDRTKVVTRGL